MKFRILIFTFLICQSVLGYACGTRCYTPHQFVISGVITKAKVIKANNPPSSSYDFLCHISIKQSHSWKEKIDKNIVVLNGHWENCKSWHKAGEEVLFLANAPDGERWMSNVARNTNYFYSPRIFSGEKREQRIKYLSTASAEDLTDEDTYCNNIIDPY